MAALVCDLCGGKLVMGSGGIAKCDSCGMEYSPERMKEKLQEAKGVVQVDSSPVQVDSSRLIENYLRMAQNAYDSGNKAEAESYCNKILETVPTHQQAWLLKGRAAGWQSTLGNIRFAEAINCFANAIANTEEDEKEAVINKCKQDVKELTEALIRLRGEHFAKWPDKEEKIGFYTGITAIVQAILQFFQAVGTLIDKDELMAPLATGINNSVMNAWHNTVRPTFANDHGGHPSDYALEKLFERAKYCTELLELAVNLSNIDYEGDIQCYKNLITINEYLINAQSYSYETVELQGSFVNDYQPRYENQYVKSKSLTEEAKKQRRQLISSYEGKIKKAHKDIFWSKYSNERKFLMKELNKCKRERDKLVAAKTGHTKIERLKKHISEIETILGKDRELTSRIEPSEKGFIESCEVFWKRLSSADYGYDAYLDQYPILKQAPELAIRREKLLAERMEIAIEKQDGLSGTLIGQLLGLFFGIIVIICGSALESTFVGVLGWLFAIPFGIASYIFFKEFLDDKASLRSREERYAKEVCEYNATIDKMLAVPKYEGNVEYDAKVKIPEKLATQTAAPAQIAAPKSEMQKETAPIQKSVEATNSELTTVQDGSNEREPRNGFKLQVDDMFTVQGAGLVVCGDIVEGTICVNDNVEIMHIGGTSTPATVSGITIGHNRFETATVGDHVGLLLSGVTKADMNKGDTVTKNNTAPNTTEMISGNPNEKEPEYSFEFQVVDYFTFRGRGLCVRGKILKGTICVNDDIEVRHTDGTSLPATVNTIVLNEQAAQTATVGEDVALILSGVTRADMNSDDIIIKNN